MKWTDAGETRQSLGELNWTGQGSRSERERQVWYNTPLQFQSCNKREWIKRLSFLESYYILSKKLVEFIKRIFLIGCGCCTHVCVGAQLYGYAWRLEADSSWMSGCRSQLLLIINSFILCVWVFCLDVCIYVPCVYLVPVKVRTSQSLWNWSYRWLLAAMCSCHRDQTWFPARVTSALSRRVNSPGPLHLLFWDRLCYWPSSWLLPLDFPGGLSLCGSFCLRPPAVTPGFVGSGDSSIGLQTCTANPWPTDHPPWPQENTFNSANMKRLTENNNNKQTQAPKTQKKSL